MAPNDTQKVSDGRSERLSMRVTPSLKGALEKAAEDDGRPLANYVERVLLKHLEEAGRPVK